MEIEKTILEKNVRDFCADSLKQPYVRYEVKESLYTDTLSFVESPKASNEYYSDIQFVVRVKDAVTANWISYTVQRLFYGIPTVLDVRGLFVNFPENVACTILVKSVVVY